MTIRWGIAGPGRIAEKFAASLIRCDSESGYLAAAASTSLERAIRFASRHDKKIKSYGSYAELANDPDIDAVYISTLHTGHAEVAEMMLRSGKSVLCEKPLALNLGQVERMQKAALENNAFLMEAMWTRFLPALVKVREWIAEERIGRVLHVSAPFSEKFPEDPSSRIFDKNLGGGGLLDIGVYPVSMAQMIFGKYPERIVSQAVIGSTGVDEMSAVILDYGGLAHAQLAISTRCRFDNRLVITGEKGRIEVPDFVFAQKALLYENTEDQVSKILQFEDDEKADFSHEIKAAAKCISEGKLECPEMSWQDSRNVMSVMDELRRQWGLVYPQEI